MIFLDAHFESKTLDVIVPGRERCVDLVQAGDQVIPFRYEF